MKKLDELPVRVLDEKTEAHLAERGRKVSIFANSAICSTFAKLFQQFARLAVGVHYQTYKGYVAQKEGWWGYQLYKVSLNRNCFQ